MSRSPRPEVVLINHADAMDADSFSNFHVLTFRLVTWIKRKPLTVACANGGRRTGVMRTKGGCRVG